MGLDQYAYVAAKRGERDAFYEQELGFDAVTRDWVVPPGGVQKPRELAQWRKHPNLQGWMEKLWLRKQDIPVSPTDQFIEDKGPLRDFNGIELELTFEDIIAPENDILSGKMASLDTTGFFYGKPSDDLYREQDLEFVKQAKAELFCGLKVFYNSSW